MMGHPLDNIRMILCYSFFQKSAILEDDNWRFMRLFMRSEVEDFSEKIKGYRLENICKFVVMQAS